MLPLIHVCLGETEWAWNGSVDPREEEYVAVAPEQDRRASWVHFSSPFTDLGDLVPKPDLSFLTSVAPLCGLTKISGIQRMELRA